MLWWRQNSEQQPSIMNLDSLGKHKKQSHLHSKYAGPFIAGCRVFAYGLLWLSRRIDGYGCLCGLWYFKKPLAYDSGRVGVKENAPCEVEEKGEKASQRSREAEKALRRK